MSETLKIDVFFDNSSFLYRFLKPSSCSFYNLRILHRKVSLTVPHVLKYLLIEIAGEEEQIMGAVERFLGSTLKTVWLGVGLLYLSVSMAFAQSDLVITGVIDGPLTGGIPKAVELYVFDDIADLSAYGVGSANNGGGSDGEEFTFPSDAVTAGTFIYVATESSAFNTFFGFNPDYTSGSAPNINGDDAIELFHNGAVVDAFGDINLDGTGQPWEYLDGWVYRNDGTGPDGSSFVLGNWSFSGPNALDGATDNASAATPFPLGTYSGDSGPPPPEPELVTIMAIQGRGHTSPFDGDTVTTRGIVTVVTNNGFYLQDRDGDNDIDTSDGLFIFTSNAPNVDPGDEVNVTGRVTEFLPGNDPENLTITEIVSPSQIENLSRDNRLPSPIVIGQDRRPPKAIIDNDGLQRYQPRQDGIDFYESLEGMRVELPTFTAVAPTNRFGEIYGVVNNGRGASGINSVGGITIDKNDFNPERIQIDDSLYNGTSPAVQVGDQLGDITGVVSYAFGNFEVLPSDQPRITQASDLRQEATRLSGDNRHITIATFNVLNLDPGDGGRFDEIADIIVENLKTPDIVALQEVQDNSGSSNNGVVSADEILGDLIDAIRQAGGPNVRFPGSGPGKQPRRRPTWRKYSGCFSF